MDVGVAAHITGASPGGARYDPTLAAKERSNAQNGIWLCQTCAKLIDSDEERFPVELLRDWKKSAEAAALVEIGRARLNGKPDSELSDLLVQHFPEEILKANLLGRVIEAKSDPDTEWVATTDKRGTTITVLRNRDDSQPAFRPLSPVFGNSQGDAERKEAWDQFLAKGTPATLTQQNVPREQLPEELRRAIPEGGVYELRMSSRGAAKLAVAMEFHGPDGATYTFPYLEMRTVRAGNREVLITNDHQPIPFKFRIRLGADLHANEEWTLQLAGVSVRWLDELRRFSKAAKPGATGIVRDLNTGREFSSVVTSVNHEEMPAAFEEFIERILVVQKATNAEILIPNRPYPSEADLMALEDIEFAIENGRPNGEISQASATMAPSPEGRQGCHDLITGATFEIAIPYSIRILDCEVNLGQLRLVCEQVHIDPRDRELAQQFANGQIDRETAFRIVAVPPARFEQELPRWKRSTL